VFSKVLNAQRRSASSILTPLEVGAFVVYRYTIEGDDEKLSIGEGSRLGCESILLIKCFLIVAYGY
jgi:hypothetical protein